MSIAVMSRVWEKSSHGGASLLMMLAIADFADDQGRAYPSVATLAQKCRVQPRTANYTIAELKASGELEVKVGAGPRGTNLYRIRLDRLNRADARTEPLQSISPLQEASGVQEPSPLKSSAPLKESSGVQPTAPLQPAAPLQSSAPTPAMGCTPPLQPIAPEPSLNHQEPSVEANASVGGADELRCPTKKIVDLYHEVLPELPRVRLQTDGRTRALARTWRWVMASFRPDGTRRATTAEEGLAWFREYFERASQNDFLMGRTAKTGAHAGWQCDLDFLLSDRGKKHVIERTEAVQ
ncbi:MAG: hypothetical protein KBC94_23175 [Pseudacidovorax sp.]|uniref:helix-turn-helix domain-containing protein n=1 Tax=Pseudacidovorax sp. TaxID=1934311 RepID=UPI001B6BFB1D|nr:helix-turn-helix domain-containing protein [Pseudacidovorax sp.]MBP6897329.1 hypothetical protein [Pseudacidovorax sp.]